VVVVLDGPAGAGKSTASKKLAQRLGVAFLDTGAMYRAFTWRALEHKVDLLDVAALVRCVDEGRLVVPTSADGKGPWLMDDRDVTQAIRTPEVTGSIFRLADVGPVRAQVTAQMRAIGRGLGSFVAEGRDLGTVVFPDAHVKIYLDASSEVRARRRLVDLENARVTPLPDLEQVKREIEERDRKDMVRAVAPLKRAPDAVYLDSSALGLDAVVDALEGIVRSAG
jgi:pantoate ligase/cytidylate kinase